MVFKLEEYLIREKFLQQTYNMNTFSTLLKIDLKNLLLLENKTKLWIK